MKKMLPAVLLIAAFSLALLATGCSGVRPVKKGELHRCPSCGVEHTEGDHTQDKK